GTTSRPKGVPLTHGNLVTSIRNIARTYALTPVDASLIVMPLFHVHGLLGATLSTLHTGGTVIIPPRFSASSFWQHAAAHRATWYSAVPTIHQVLLSRAEAAIRGANVMRGYNNNPDANATAFASGYFRTGDQGMFDADGYLTLTGRIKELINRGGEKISPLEVDAALLEHPAVAEAVCFAVPDPKYGEEVHGAVVLKANAEADDIVAFCRDRLADFKVPKKIHIADALPRTATGKIQRRHVAAHFLKQGTK